MASEHHDQEAAYDDVNIRSLALVGGVGTVLVITAVVAVQVLYFRYDGREFVRKVEVVPTAAVNEILAQQRERIAKPGPGAVPEKGEKSIPIADAMRLIVAEYRSDAADHDTSDPSESGNTEGTESTK